jgi:hypothetical protein
MADKHTKAAGASAIPSSTPCSAKVVALPQRAIGPAENTRACQIRQFLGERLASQEPIAAIVIMATAEGELVTHQIGIAPTLLQVMGDEATYIGRRLRDDLAERRGATVHQLRLVRVEDSLH